MEGQVVDKLKTDGAGDKRVLLVDDEGCILRGIKQTLDHSGISIDTAESREEGLKFLDNTAYDCVVSDINLADAAKEEGFDILRHVKKERPETRVIIMSGNGSPELKAKAYVLGADLYFEKPVSVGVLKSALMTLLRINCGGAGSGTEANEETLEGVEGVSGEK